MVCQVTKYVNGIIFYIKNFDNMVVDTSNIPIDITLH